MRDEGYQREWVINLTKDTIPGKVTITEDRHCDGYLANTVGRYWDAGKLSYKVVTKKGCGLTFRVSEQATLELDAAIINLVVMIRSKSGWMRLQD